MWQYAAAVDDRAKGGDGPRPAEPDRPPTEDEYVALSRAMWGWADDVARAAYRKQMGAAANG